MDLQQESDPIKPPWWPTFRRIVVFLLGVCVIIDALFDRNYVVPELIMGLILVGVLPLDDLVRLVTHSNRERDDDTGTGKHHQQ